MSADNWLKNFKRVISYNSDRPEFKQLAEQMDTLEYISTHQLFNALTEALNPKLNEGYRTYHSMFEDDENEYDNEGDMAKDQLVTIADAAEELHNMMADDTNLPEWCQAKISRAMEDLDAVRDYLFAQYSDIDDEEELKDLDLDTDNDGRIDDADIEAELDAIANECLNITEVLKVSDGVGTWIKDFQASDAPQFKGKNKDERKKMAIAAFLDAERKEQEENNEMVTKEEVKKHYKKLSELLKTTDII